MSETFTVLAEPRTDAGKGASRRLRRQGRIPAIVYGGHQEPEMISLHHNILLQHLEHEAFYSQVLNLQIGERVSKVVLKDLQRHPAKPFVLHVDFQRVVESEKLRMTVPLHFINEHKSKGVKAGGLVSHHLTEIEVSCLPSNLPEFIEIDMADMKVGDSLHLSELPLPEGVELAHKPDPDLPVVSIQGTQASAAAGQESEESR